MRRTNRGASNSPDIPPRGRLATRRYVTFIALAIAAACHVPLDVDESSQSVQDRTDQVLDWNQILVDTLIASNISKWLSLNKLSGEQFHLRRKRSEEVPVRTGASVLEVLIDSLDKRQLQSINLSMEVVATLFRKRI